MTDEDILTEAGLGDRLFPHARIFRLIKQAGDRGLSMIDIERETPEMAAHRRYAAVSDLIDCHLIFDEGQGIGYGRRRRIYRERVSGPERLPSPEHARVLKVIRGKPEGLSGHELANRTRFVLGLDRRKEILAALERGGFITITEAKTGGAGRPGLIYRAKAHSGNMPHDT